MIIKSHDIKVEKVVGCEFLPKAKIIFTFSNKKKKCIQFRDNAEATAYFDRFLDIAKQKEKLECNG